MATQVPSPLTAGVGTIPGLLRWRAGEQPDQLGYVFLADGEAEESPLTYGQAHRRAGAVAAALLEAGVPAGARAILVMPPGLDYLTALFGCLYAGVIAVPVYPPDPFNLERSLPRLRAIVADAGASAALTSVPLLSFLDEVTRVAPELGELRWIAVDAESVPAAADDVAETAGLAPPAMPALLQYTSGSTAAPRGVMLTHANLLHNLGLI